MPAPTREGVFGMARTTGIFAGMRCSMYEVGTDAAIEMMSWSSRSSGLISSTTSPSVCGLIHSRMTSAFFTAARLSVVTLTPNFAASASTRSA